MADATKVEPSPEVVFLYPSTVGPDHGRRPGRGKGENGWTIHDVEEWASKVSREADAQTRFGAATTTDGDGASLSGRKPVHHSVTLREGVHVQEDLKVSVRAKVDAEERIVTTEGPAHRELQATLDVHVAGAAVPPPPPSSSTSGPGGGGLNPGARRHGAALARNAAVVWDETFEALVSGCQRFFEHGFVLREHGQFQNIGTLWFSWLDGPPGVDARQLAGTLLSTLTPNNPPPAPASPPPSPGDAPPSLPGASGDVELDAINGEGAFGAEFGPVVVGHFAQSSASPSLIPPSAIPIPPTSPPLAACPCGGPLAGGICRNCISAALRMAGEIREAQVRQELREELRAEILEEMARETAGPGAKNN